MRAKRISSDEQLKLITKCRQSGLSDYQWCQANDVNPGTFYNWISRLRKKGMTIPVSAFPSQGIGFDRTPPVLKTVRRR